jgi:hypothetical protein
MDARTTLWGIADGELGLRRMKDTNEWDKVITAGVTSGGAGTKHVRGCDGTGILVGAG